MRVLITGDTGFIGRHLCLELSAKKYEAIGLRKYCGQNGLIVPRFGESLLPLLEKLRPEGVVHCALNRNDPTGEKNVSGTATWAAECRQTGVDRQVFVSSISAGSVSSAYGRSKRALENRFSEFGGVSLRLGLVMGDGGVFATLCGLLRRFHCFPLMNGGKNRVFPLLVTHVSLAVDRIFGTYDDVSGRVKSLYEPGDMTMKVLLSQMAGLMGIRYVGVPCPYGLLWSPVRAMEMVLGGKSPITVDNLLGLKEDTRPEQPTWLDDLSPRRPSIIEQMKTALALLHS